MQQQFSANLKRQTNEQTEARTANSTYPQLAVKWYQEDLC